MTIGTMFQDILESFFKKSATRLYPVERIAPPSAIEGFFPLILLFARVAVYASRIVRRMPFNWSSWIELPNNM